MKNNNKESENDEEETLLASKMIFKLMLQLFSRTMCPWESPFTSVSFSFLIYRVGIIKMPTL